MKNIKDITLLAFAVVGFYTIITAFSSTESNQPQQVYTTPESHVWEMVMHNERSIYSVINKVTGEVIFYDKILKSSVANIDAKYKIRKPIN